MLMERASLFHLEINGMRKLVNVTYLGSSECLSIWLETYTSIIKWVTQWIHFRGKNPLDKEILELNYQIFFCILQVLWLGLDLLKCKLALEKLIQLDCKLKCFNIVVPYSFGAIGLHTPLLLASLNNYSFNNVGNRTWIECWC
jgi:hypothetical protein